MNLSFVITAGIVGSIEATFDARDVIDAMEQKKSESGHVVITDKDGMIIWDLFFDGSLEHSVALGLGDNSGKFQSYIEGGFKGTLDMTALTEGFRDEDDDPLKLTLSGSLFLQAKMKALLRASSPFEASRSFNKELVKFEIYPHLQILSNDNDVQNLSMRSFSENAEPLSRDYVQYKLQSPDSMRKSVELYTLRKGASDASSFSRNNMFPYSEPTLFPLSDGRKLLVWVDDFGEKSDSNRTTIAYSVYSDGAWSAAAPVFENGAYKTQVIDENTGCANVLHFVNSDGQDVIVATNREIDEAAMYTFSE